MPTKSSKISTVYSPVRPQTLVLDNGGYSIKAGLVGEDPVLGDCSIIPNCVARDSGKAKRTYIGADLEKCNDYFHLVMRRPVEKGMIVNWDLERTIWHHTFISERNAIFDVSALAGIIPARVLTLSSATRMTLISYWPKLPMSFRSFKKAVTRWSLKSLSLVRITDASVRL